MKKYNSLPPNRDRLTVVHDCGHKWLPQTQTWLYNQVLHLPEHVESHIVCEITENLDQFWVPNIHSLRDTSNWQFVRDKLLRKLGIRSHLGFLVDKIEEHQAHILHSHFGTIGWADMKAASQTGVKQVVTFYGQDVSFFPSHDSRWYERYHRLFDHVDVVLCEGPHMARSVAQLGCPEVKLRVHHLGVCIDEIPFKPRVWNSAEPLRVLMAASFQEKKGIPYALAALGNLKDEVPLEITVIGDAKSETRSQLVKKEILATIASFDLTSNVRMLGYQSHDAFFQEAYHHHIFMSPSVTAHDGDTEGGAPVTLIEIAATGMPIVSTEHCDIPEVLRHPEMVFLAPERDVASLIESLRWLIRNPDKWERIVTAGRARVAKHFDARIQGQRLASIYEGLIAKS